METMVSFSPNPPVDKSCLTGHVISLTALEWDTDQPNNNERRWIFYVPWREIRRVKVMLQMKDSHGIVNGSNPIAVP